MFKLSRECVEDLIKKYPALLEFYGEFFFGEAAWVSGYFSVR